MRHRLAERDLTFAVNVSPVQLRSPGFADGVLDRLAEHGVPADRLVLEVTESSFVHVGDLAVPQIERLAEAGVVIAVDDFGAGRHRWATCAGCRCGR